jgi:chromosomal replication initiation ATPase DnaA
MKKQIFNHFIKSITKLFDITEGEMFAHSKKRSIVDARQLLYFLCALRDMRYSTIQEYLKERDVDVSHTTIIHGVKQMQLRMNEDRDIASIISTINRSI